MGIGLVIKQRGDWKKTRRLLRRASDLNDAAKMDILRRYGERGVEALSDTTPIDTGLTANSWSYEIIREGNDRYSLIWKNSNVVDGVNIAVILQCGHGTRRGGYFPGIDYINPALRPIFDEMAKELWEEMSVE